MYDYDSAIFYTFVCPECGNKVQTSYTRDDLQNMPNLHLSCGCGYHEFVKTKEIADSENNTPKSA
jgi:predicted nucleic-acid-binding Zn-ribbon protein